MDDPLELDPLLPEEPELLPEDDDLELLLLDLTADLDELLLDRLILVLPLDLLLPEVLLRFKFKLVLPDRFRVEFPPVGFPRMIMLLRLELGFNVPDLLVVPVLPD